MRFERAGLLVLTLLLLPAAEASAEWQIRPSLGASFGGTTTLIDLERASGNPNVVIGGAGAFLRDVFGIEMDFGYAPGFFQSGDQQLVQRSSVTTLTGNAVIALPRHLTQYTLGPYFVVGGGLMHATSVDFLGALSIASTMPAMDIGGGVNGFLSDHIGLNWDVRHFWSVGGGELRGLSIGPQQASEQLSFWRASMGLVIRY